MIGTGIVGIVGMVRLRHGWAACILALMVMWIAGCGKEPVKVTPMPRLVSAVQVRSGGVAIEGEFPGRAAASEQVMLSFRVSGRLVELPARVGDVVKAGQVLAQLDRRDFQLALEIAQGRLAKAVADVEVAESDYQRGVNIQKENAGAISQAVIDQRAGALKQAKAMVLSAQASVDDARNALSDTTLTAPFDTVIVERLIENFEDVQARKPVLRLVDASKVKMTFQLPEQFISRLENVAAYVCRFDAYPMVEISAKVYEVGTEALATTRTYPVTLIMDQVEGASILPGMSGRVRVRLKEGVFGTDRGLVVPAGAVFSDEKNQKYVWVVDAASKRVKRTAVTVNRVLSQGLLVEGLSEGAWVVQAGVNLLTDNQQVRLPGNGGSAT